jgi:PFU (PLAA family ubiquitin binding)
MYDGDQYFEKGEYDYIFDVDYDGVPRKLPFNEGENVLEAAEKFLAREGLGRAYVEQICIFIKNNTRGTAQQKKAPVQKKNQEVSKKFWLHKSFICIN